MSDFTGGRGGSRPSQTMSDFWPDLFLMTTPKPGFLFFFIFFRVLLILVLRWVLARGGDGAFIVITDLNHGQLVTHLETILLFILLR